MHSTLNRSLRSRSSSVLAPPKEAAKSTPPSLPPKNDQIPDDKSSLESLINDHLYKQEKFFTLKNINILRYTYFVELIDNFNKIEDFYAPKHIGFASFQFNVDAPRTKLSEDIVDPHTPSPSKLGNPFQDGPLSIRSLLSSSNGQFWNALYQELKMDNAIFASIPSYDCLLTFLIDLIDTFLDTLLVPNVDGNNETEVKISSAKPFSKLYGDLNHIFHFLGPTDSNSKLLLKVIEELVENIRIYQLRTKAEFYDILSEFLRFLLLHLLSPERFSTSKSCGESFVSTPRTSIFLPQLDPYLSASSSINSNLHCMIPRHAHIPEKEDLVTLSSQRLRGPHRTLANYLISSLSDNTIGMENEEQRITTSLPPPGKTLSAKTSTLDLASMTTTLIHSKDSDLGNTENRVKSPISEPSESSAPNAGLVLGPARKESKYFLRPPSEKRKRFLDRFKKIQDSEAKAKS